MQVYLTLEDYETAERNGINRRIATRRVDEGWSVEDAITVPVKKREPFAPIWDEWQEVARSNGISRDTMYQRIRKFGMTAEEAATRPLAETKSRWTDEQRQLMERNGLDTNTVNMRIKHLGWTEQAALHTPVLSQQEVVRRAARASRIRRRANESNKII